MSNSYFKYLSVAGASAVLSNQSLRWATCSTFNDPADIQVDLEARFDKEAVIARSLELIWLRCMRRAGPAANQVGKFIDLHADHFLALGEAETKKQMRLGVEAAADALPSSVSKFSTMLMPDLARMKIICFSEIKGSMLMWSHYAENHAGIVLEFQNAESCDSVYKMSRPINYSSHPPQFSDSETIAKILAGDENIRSDVIDAMIYTKSEEWAYERELRICSGDGREPEKQIEYAGFFAEELVGVYFGCKATQGTRNLLVPLVKDKYRAAAIWQARRESYSYQLDFDRIL